MSGQKKWDVLNCKRSKRGRREKKFGDADGNGFDATKQFKMSQSFYLKLMASGIAFVMFYKVPLFFPRSWHLLVFIFYSSSFCGPIISLFFPQRSIKISKEKKLMQNNVVNLNQSPIISLSVDSVKSSTMNDANKFQHSKWWSKPLFAFAFYNITSAEKLTHCTFKSHQIMYILIE